MVKRIILAALAGSVVQFLLGFLIYGLLLAKFMESCSVHYEGLMKDMSGPSFMILMFLSGLVMDLLFAIIFQRWAKFDTFAKGMGGGMIIGFFFALSFDLGTYAMMNLMSATGLVVDVICATILNGIVGGVIGWVLGMGKKAEVQA
jgi:hypothetical protein